LKKSKKVTDEYTSNKIDDPFACLVFLKNKNQRVMGLKSPPANNSHFLVKLCSFAGRQTANS
jgi:hypothetical protein